MSPSAHRGAGTVGLTALALLGCRPAPPPPPPPPLLTGPHRLVEVDAVTVSTPLGYPDTRGCGIVRSGPWRALVRDRADGARDLVILGTVGVKPSASVSIALNPLVRESDPVQREAQLRVTHPPEPTIDMLEQRLVEATLTYRPPLGRLSLMCGARELARFSDPREER